MLDAYPDLASLALFVKVCETGSISAAGRSFDLTQPVATARVRKLESHLGMSLLSRSTSGCTPTDIGGAIVEWAREVIASADRLVAGAAALQRATKGVALRITASYTIAEYLLPQVLVELRRSSRSTAVTLSVSNSMTVIDDILTGRCELGFIESDAVLRGMRHQQVATDRLVIIAATDNPVGSRRPIGPEELVSHTLVLREQGSGTREVFIKALDAAGAQRPASILEIGSTAAVMRATAAGDALGIVSELAMRGNVHAGFLRTVPTRGLGLERSLRAIWLAEQTRAVAAVVSAALLAGSRLNSAALTDTESEARIAPHS